MPVPRGVRSVVEAMAMPFVVEVVAGSGSATRAEIVEVIEAFHRDLAWADEVFSMWRDDTPMSRLSRGEIGVDDCPPAVAEVFALCDRYRTETDGFFDARRPDGVLDPTGIVKTWAVARATWRLDALAPAGWLVGASGDTIASGVGPDGGPWRVGIADPRLEGNPQSVSTIDVVHLGGVTGADFRALASSGTSQHGEHIWNPRTGENRAEYLQVSVVGSDVVECDAWATAIVAGGREVALAAQRYGLEVLCVPSDGDPSGRLRVEASPGWPGGVSG